jgi:S-formylglutathione hydrolase FrmB
MNFESQYLRNNTEISIILPDKPRDQEPAEFYGSGAKYKVLWLLHGTYGDHTDWLRKSSIELYACEKNLAVVMPSALNSNYSNWDDFAIGYSMYDFMTEELMPLIYNWFPISDKREDNYIAGLSMGGGGSIKFAVNHPEKFAAAAILSSAPRNLRAIDLETANARTLTSIKNAGGLEAYVDSYENAWDKLAELNGKGVLPRLYFACGTEDFLRERFDEFKRYAQEIKLDATFEDGPGGHEWRFWDTYIQKALVFFGLDDGDAGNPF